LARFPSAWVSFWQTLTRFQKEKIFPWLALRITIGVMGPLIIGAAIDQIHAGLAVATGALNVAWSDSHEPYRIRARRMLASSVLVGMAVFTGTVCGHYRPAVIAVATVWAFVVGMLVALSQTAADIGVISLVVLLVYSSVPQSIDLAISAGLLAFTGGLVQTGLALALWPLRRYEPERRALRQLYSELSRAAQEHIDVEHAPPASAASTQAQSVLSPLYGDHSIESERYLFLLSQAERLRVSLLALRRIRARLRRDSPASEDLPVLEQYFEICGRVLASIALLLTDTGVRPEPMPPLPQLPLTSAPEARIQMNAISGQLRSAFDLASSATPEGLITFAQRESALPWWLRLRGTIATLRANITWEGAVFRHAVRLAVCAGAGTALSYGLGFQRAYWLPMTVAIVLKPDFTATFSRGVLRLAGTFTGLVLASILFHVVPNSMPAHLGLLAVLLYVMRWIGSANYGILVVAVTAMVVALFTVAGIPPMQVISARAVNTAVGGVIALLAYILWPTWERRAIHENIARLLDAYRLYFQAVCEHSPTLEQIRINGRLVRSNLEASIDRLSAEPGTPPETIRLLGSMLPSSHRMVHAMIALEAALIVEPPPEFSAFAADVEKTLFQLSAALRGSPFYPQALPDLRHDQLALAHGDALLNAETDRITNSLNTLTEQVIVYTGTHTETHDKTSLA
jgi:uncharacterized membrane protein YccC